MSQGNEPRIDHSLRLPAADGFRLAATLHEPGEVRYGQTGGAVVLINPATAVPRGYYDGFARFLAGRGFSVLTYNYRGIGGSRPGNLRASRPGCATGASWTWTLWQDAARWLEERAIAGTAAAQPQEEPVEVPAIRVA